VRDRPGTEVVLARGSGRRLQSRLRPPPRGSGRRSDVTRSAKNAREGQLVEDAPSAGEHRFFRSRTEMSTFERPYGRPGAFSSAGRSAARARHHELFHRMSPHITRARLFLSLGTLCRHQAKTGVSRPGIRDRRFLRHSRAGARCSGKHGKEQSASPVPSDLPRAHQILGRPPREAVGHNTSWA
jgi:hypothetical protein